MCPRFSVTGLVREWSRDLKSTQWFREVRAYRNLAHRMFHLIQVLHPNGGGPCVGFFIPQALPTQRAMLGSAGMTQYVLNMRQALDALTAPATPAEIAQKAAAASAEVRFEKTKRKGGRKKPK
jgi:hypothetical protein